MSEQAMDPASAPLYPIREVSRLTGVNSVTLRAWERRYGLIRPQRTPKGHRLYAREDIQRVERILQWLNRGVPVSQVRDLLEQSEPAANDAPPPDISDWESQRQQLLQAVDTLDGELLETLFNRSMALYPTSVCIAELWQPVVDRLEERWSDQFGAELQRRQLESFLRTRIGMRLYHANHVTGGARLLLVRLPEERDLLRTLLLALAASASGFRVEWLETDLPINELALAAERFKVDALVMTSGHAERSDLIRRQLPRLGEQLDVPLCLVGPVTRIRGAELENTQVASLGDDLPAALSRLHGLLGR
ncbi:MerR family transcriptional regulator [Chromohalobacter israelensis]|uniref:Transcriptional regulator, MerR family n=1 Tax=Chromohalobacter israelensis (strain ATCC BAA-138 / DSM 3043 / CIP 106854 / NCIMB 13768 / 1H11) TaxID=290398 RepID=Q1R0D0_CHRI1|nr:MerR family transcriptional regulator [Chromohalobacter salexigens]ABE57828.1 transcriptional regulator, MerR family [Chromohalobacter salexigens DSM 3043]NWO57835.1 MerR family transcriptional regulator [Chromohalobacter salexigens]RXE46976.1 MerR family transcriptional regulator [Chromohalobacter salexigens]